MSKPISALLICLSILLLSGCTHISSQKTISAPVQEGLPSSQKINNLSNLINWKAEGKLVAIHESDAVHASFIWEQQGPQYKIRFFGPLGMSGGSLSGNMQIQEIVFQNAQGVKKRASSPEQLLLDETGLYFPVSNLSYWIKGLPNPTRPLKDASYDEAGLLTDLKQDHWNILYSNYVQCSENQNLFLPTHIKVKNKNVSLKLAIKSWS